MEDNFWGELIMLPKLHTEVDIYANKNLKKVLRGLSDFEMPLARRSYSACCNSYTDMQEKPGINIPSDQNDITINLNEEDRKPTDNLTVFNNARRASEVEVIVSEVKTNSECGSDIVQSQVFRMRRKRPPCKPIVWCDENFKAVIIMPDDPIITGQKKEEPVLYESLNVARSRKGSRASNTFITAQSNSRNSRRKSSVLQVPCLPKPMGQINYFGNKKAKSTETDKQEDEKQAKTERSASFVKELSEQKSRKSSKSISIFKESERSPSSARVIDEEKSRKSAKSVRGFKEEVIDLESDEEISDGDEGLSSEEEEEEDLLLHFTSCQDVTPSVVILLSIQILSL